MLMIKKFYINVLWILAIITIYGVKDFVTDNNVNQLNKLDEKPQIAPIENKSTKIVKLNSVINKVETFPKKEMESLPFSSKDPYKEIRLRGAENPENDTSSYIDKTIKLENNQDQNEVNIYGAQVENPYNALKESNQKVPETDTLRYVESTTALGSDF